MTPPKVATERLAAVFLIAAIVLAVVPSSAVAQSQTGMGGTVVVEEDETVSGIDAVAGSVIVRGTVEGDVNAAAGNVYVYGTVEGDVNAATGNLEITGAVEGDVSTGAGNVVVAEGATIGGAFEAGAGNVRIDGAVDGDATIGADLILLGESAAIAGDLRYDGDLEGNTAAVSGDVTRDRTLGPQLAPTLQPIASWLFAAYAFVLNLLLGAALLALFPGFSAGIANRVAADPVRTGAVGLLVLVAVPALLVAFAVTVVGIPISIAGAFAFALVIWIAVVYGRFAVGAWLLSSADVENRWAALVVGLIVGAVLSLIPVVGGLLNLLIVLLGLGALSAGLYGRRRRSDAAPTAVGSDEATSN